MLAVGIQGCRAINICPSFPGCAEGGMGEMRARLRKVLS